MHTLMVAAPGFFKPWDLDIGLMDEILHHLGALDYCNS